MKSRAIQQHSKKDFLLVTLLWLFFQALWYFSLGIHFDLEAEKYIREADYLLLNKSFSEARYLFYFSTTAVIALCKMLGLGLYGALFTIMVINLFSYQYFFKALRQFFGERLPAYLVIFLLLSFWPYQSWTLYLYTECFFYSAVLLLFSQLILYRLLSLKFLLLTTLFLLLVIISRPLGILFVFPTLLFIFVKLSKKQKIYFAFAALVSLLLFNYIVQTVFTTTSDWSLQKTITEADIICNIPGPDAGQKLNLSNHPNQLYQLLYYVTHNFSHFAKLALLRLQYFYTMVRDYYSVFHNIFLLVYIGVIYASILLGIKRIVKILPLALGVFIFTAISLFTFTIALQCDDYHNRFILTLMPFFFTLSVIVLFPLLYRIPFFEKRLPQKNK